ncbi:hypothetical protein KC339_g148 [Hortaea werneckii]|nr:hypothetical protein KC339_g148 [Hortaea werneckii]
MKDLLVVLVIASHRLNDPLYPVNRAAQPLTGDEGRKITIQPAHNLVTLQQLGISAESHLPHEEVLVFIEVAREEMRVARGRKSRCGSARACWSAEAEPEARVACWRRYRSRPYPGPESHQQRVVRSGQKDGRHLIAAGQADCASEGRVHHKGAIRAQLGGGEGGEGIEEERRGFLVGADAADTGPPDADDGHDDALSLSPILASFSFSACSWLYSCSSQPSSTLRSVFPPRTPTMEGALILLSQSRHYHSTSPSVDGRGRRTEAPSCARGYHVGALRAMSVWRRHRCWVRRG